MILKKRPYYIKMLAKEIRESSSIENSDSLSYFSAETVAKLMYMYRKDIYKNYIKNDTKEKGI